MRAKPAHQIGRQLLALPLDRGLAGVGRARLVDRHRRVVADRGRVAYLKLLRSTGVDVVQVAGRVEDHAVRVRRHQQQAVTRERGPRAVARGPAVSAEVPAQRREHLPHIPARLRVQALRGAEALLPHRQQVRVGRLGRERRERQHLLGREGAVPPVGRLAQDAVHALDDPHRLRVPLLDVARHLRQ